MLFFNTIKTFFLDLTAPDPLFIKDESERIVFHLKNKFLVFMQILFIIMNISHYFIINENPTRQPTTYLLLFGFIFFIKDCRKYPTRVYVFHSLMTAMATPLHYLFNPKNLGLHYYSIITNPLILMYISEKRIYPIMSLVSETLLLKFYYLPYINDSPKVWALINENFLASNVFASIFNILMMCTFHENILTYQRAYHKNISELSEVEKQRTFILSFSHEIRNLLNSLIGSLQICLLEADPKSKLMNYLNEAKICTEILLHLMNNVLDSGKIIANDLEITNSKCTIYETLRDTWTISSELLKKKWLSGVLKISHRVPEHMILDKYRISQILLNLIGNAAKFTERGRVEVTVDFINKNTVEEDDFLPNPYDDADEEGIYSKNSNMNFCDENYSIFYLGQKVKVANRNYDAGLGVLKVSVSDTGKGISPENIPKLFKQFSKLSVGYNRQLGTGLGLYITKNLCMGMRGDIRVFSKKNVGTTFVVCVLAESVMYVPTELSSDLSTHIKKSEINALVIDDEPLSRNVIVNFLRRLKIKNIVEASTGLEGYEKYVEATKTGLKFNFVTMDIHMPVCDGKSSAKMIREYENNNKLAPTILTFISGNCTHSEINECLDKKRIIRGDYFLKKPVSYDEVLKIIEKKFA